MDNKIISVIISAVVVVVLIGAFLMPIVSDAQRDIGDPITYTNEGGLIFREVKNGDVLIVERTVIDGVTTDVITLNGEPVAGTVPNATANLFLSDGVYFRKGITTQAGVCSAFIIGESVSSNIVTTSSTAVITVEFGNGTVSATKKIGEADATSYFTGTFTWGFVASPVSGATHYVSESGTGLAYVNDDSELVLCGAYETGDLDTMYTYYKGKMTVYTPGYTASLDKGLIPVDGTTDIYTSKPVVSVTNGITTETFTPYRYLVPMTIEGHESSGAAYGVIGTLPIIVIVVSILAIIGVAVKSRY